MAAKDVDITLQNETPTANPDPIHLSHGQGHTVTWDNHLDEDIVVSFDNGTPFSAQQYPVPAHQRRDSGPIQVQPGTQPWKYTITTASGKTNDPQVIVNN